ncbi:MAG: hypothetical protein EYC70_14515 [Planctomycetota bacterium]|nr:MAG: hypothetical protein EYC70_14515 [Planctomycetota bacterium]
MVTIYSFRPFLRLSRSSLPAAAGGLVQFELQFPGAEALCSHAILASAAGTGPGTMGGLVVPLGAVPVFRRSIQGTTPPGAAGMRRQLDRSAAARATWEARPGALARWTGGKLWFAAVSFQAGVARCSSAAAGLAILP